MKENEDEFEALEKLKQQNKEKKLITIEEFSEPNSEKIETVNALNSTSETDENSLKIKKDKKDKKSKKSKVETKISAEKISNASERVAKVSKRRAELESHEIPDTTAEEVKLKKVEIILPQSIEEDLLEGFRFNKIEHYTQIPSVLGCGYSVPKLGNEIWPQFNTMFIVYCNKEDAKKIKDLIKTLRKLFVGEGIACFVSKAKEW